MRRTRPGSGARRRSGECPRAQASRWSPWRRGAGARTPCAHTSTRPQAVARGSNPLARPSLHGPGRRPARGARPPTRPSPPRRPSGARAARACPPPPHRTASSAPTEPPSTTTFESWRWAARSPASYSMRLRRAAARRRTRRCTPRPPPTWRASDSSGSWCPPPTARA